MTKLGAAFGDWQGARLAGIAIALTLSVGPAPAAAAAPGGDPGKPEAAPNGGPGRQGNPGSERAKQVRSQKAPESASKPAKAKGRKLGATKGKKVRRRGSPDQAAKTSPPQAKAGKTTICHSTGSETNPYVEITVSNNALNAHGRHHDGADIIPAPAGGCEQTTTAAVASDGQTAAAAGVRSARRSERADARDAVDTERTRSRVLGAEASSPDTARSGEPLAEEEDQDEDSLPFTGLALLGILATALLALAGGVAARRSVS